jgi:predicted dehydrogenase
MADRIRLGVIGANIHRGWAPRSHLPALAASPEFELAAVCTTRRESAEESARMFGARLAFDNYQDMLAHPDIDAVAVVLRVPSHYEPTMAALNAGKHVYTEWPLGQSTAQAQEMADTARSKGVKTMVGLQARANPAIMYLKDLVEGGYVGEVMSCHVSMIRGGVLQRVSDRTWQRDVTLGANTLTIAFGHTVDALRFIAGDFNEVSSVVSTQAKQWLATDTQEWLDVTSPDNVLVSGRLDSGAVASVHVAASPYAGSGLRLEIYGREGTLIASSDDSPQLKEVHLQGAQDSDKLTDLEVPARYTYVLEGMPRGEAFNVGQMYYRFGEAIRSGGPCEPNFDTAVDLHKFIDNIQESAEQGRQVAVATA